MTPKTNEQWREVVVVSACGAEGRSFEEAEEEEEEEEDEKESPAHEAQPRSACPAVPRIGCRV